MVMNYHEFAINYATDDIHKNIIWSRITMNLP